MARGASPSTSGVRQRRKSSQPGATPQESPPGGCRAESPIHPHDASEASAQPGRDGTPCRPLGERSEAVEGRFPFADGTECHPYPRLRRAGGDLAHSLSADETGFQP